ncbi:MAG: InlB B-repeat-containing protein [Bacilli bacterium]|nr:InlB B-repeat-containing protein [Bacilli bacterium]
MKKTKFLNLVAVASLLSSCGPHNHTFSEKWENDDSNHWHVATCEHVELTKDLASHLFDENNVCVECGYVKVIPHEHTFSKEWSHDQTNHWHAATCEHSDLTKDFGEHVDSNGDDRCDVCNYNLHVENHFVVVFVDGTKLLFDPIILGENEKVYQPADPVKEGHAFMGWYETPDFSGEPYDFEQIVTKNLTLHAKFEVCEYKIIYHNAENIVHNDPNGYVYGVGVESFDESAHDSEGIDKFYGWYFDEGLTKPAISVSKNSTGDIDLYAKRSEIFKIDYENWPEDLANPNPVEYTALDEVVFDSGDMKKYPGFQNIVFKEGEETVEKIPFGSNGDKTVKVDYDLTKTKVIFDPNGGSLIPDQTYIYVDFGEGVGKKKLNLPLSSTKTSINIYDQTVFELPEKEGYCFAGYFLDKDYKTRISETDENVIPSGSTIYAKWEEIPEGSKGNIPVYVDRVAEMPENVWQVDDYFNYSIPYYFNNSNVMVYVYVPTAAADGIVSHEVNVTATKRDGGEKEVKCSVTLLNDKYAHLYTLIEDWDISMYKEIEVHQRMSRFDGNGRATASLTFAFSKGEYNPYRKGMMSAKETTEKYEEEYAYWDIPSIKAQRKDYVFTGWFDSEGNKIDFSKHWIYTESEIKVKASWLNK